MHFADEAENLAAAQIVVEDRVIGQVSDPTFHLHPVGLTIEPVDPDAANRGYEDAHHHANGRGLAGTVGTEKAENFALVDGQFKTLDRDEFAIRLAKMQELDHRASLAGRRTHRNAATKPAAGARRSMMRTI